jgi:MFS superfamily sulfate permease-like transporter
LLPQALSQAQLANLPPIYGLYTSIIPTATYAFFGSSMILTVGPTALISLLTGSLLTKYGIDAKEDLDLALDTAAQAAFCVGFIIAILGVLNMGNLINFMSDAVMAGFTTGAALIIGLTQIRSAVGYKLQVPQVGGEFEGETVHYYYEVMKWWKDNWDEEDAEGHTYRNFYAVHVIFLFVVFVISYS